ncbi:MAG TPA: serine hydrolase domain-containing protein [Pyrinomonadaceae bacterium]|nr:serine hydrolase domain-containing protein [Pyrinomonadaceae bacterium]
MKWLLAMIALLVLAGVAVSQSKAKSKNPMAEDIRTYMSRIEGFGFSGALLVAKDGKVLVESELGLADRVRKIPVKVDTLFDVGSVTKQFTAAAIMALESDGKLSVDNHISKYFANTPEDKRSITIHHLLTHSAGLEMDFGDGDYEKVSRDEIVRRAMQSPLRSGPGERYAYSNAGYSLLAAIVEIVSAKKFDTFLRERLFAPAGMTSAGYSFSKEQVHKFARGYRDGEDWGVGAEKSSATGGEFWNLIGNGGVHSTVGDMNRWMAALEAGKVLPKESVEKLFSPHVQVTANYRRSNTPLHYGYGWNVWKQPNGKTLIFHLGGNGVFNAAARYHRDDRTVVVYLSNVSEFHDPSYPVPAIERIVAGEIVEMPPKVVPLSASRIAGYSGRYRETGGGFLEVEAKTSFLKIEGEGQAALSFVATGKWENDEKLCVFNERMAKVVEDSRTNRFDLVLSEYESGSTLTEVAELETLFWKKRYDRHGEYKDTRVLGTLPSRLRAYAATSLVAIDFKRGTTYREYFWTPDGKIGDLGPIVAPPVARFFPLSQNCFARFDPAEAVIVSNVCFEAGGIFDVIQKADRIRLKKHARS